MLRGVNQGFCWSTTVNMRIDLVGPARRGLAMGFNEASGYLAVSLAAFASGYLASSYGLRPVPFYLGVAFALAGLALSVLFVRETHGHARHESHLLAATAPGETAERPSFARILLLGSWREPALFAASQAGMVNNLNDGMAWGLFPLFFAAAGLGIREIGVLAAVYPGVWGLGQLGTGVLSDRLGRKGLIVALLLALVATLVVPGWGIPVTLLAIATAGGAVVGWALWRRSAGMLA